MKPTAWILLLGLIAGTAAHFGWLAWTTPSRMPQGTDAHLTWLRDGLGLTDAQFERIQVLHTNSAPQLKALAARVEQMRAELAAFEQTRRTEDRIDFLEFARFVEQRRRLGRECARSTERLVAATAEVLTPAQRARYFDLLEPALKRRPDPSS